KREGEPPSVKLTSGVDPGDVVNVISLQGVRLYKALKKKLSEPGIPMRVQRLNAELDMLKKGLDKEAALKSPNIERLKIFIEEIDFVEIVLKDELAGTVQPRAPRSYSEIAAEKKLQGIKLTSGVDPADAFKAIKNLYDGLRKAKEVPLKRRIKEAGREAKRKGLDVSANIKVDLERYAGDAGVRIGEQLILQKGANARASAIYKQARKEVFGRLSHNEMKQLDDVIFSRRVIEIDRIHGEGVKKHPGGFGGEQHKAYLTQLAQSNPKLFNDLMNRADTYFELMKDQLKQLRDEGLLTEEDYNVLRKFDYSRRQLIDKIDPEVIKPGKRGISVRDSGVEELAKGREIDVLETDANLLMLEVISRTQGRIMKNRANKMLLDLAKADSTNPFVRIKTKESKVPRGWIRIELFDEGVKRSVYLSKDFAKEWVAADVEISYQLANAIRILSGSAILRPMATGIAPGFAFANLPRDIAHIWLTSQTFIDGKWQSTYSPFAPKFIGEMGLDLATVFSDAVLRKGRWDRYVEEGGGMEFLSQGQGKMLKKRLGKETALDTIQDVLGYINVTSEILTRLALRERSIKKQGRAEGLTPEMARLRPDITTRATAVARDYMDFGQGGAYIKALDTGLPYTSAAVQGTRGIFRSIKRDYKTFAVKVTQLGAFVTGLYLANSFVNKEAYDSISDEIKKANFVFTTPWKYKDEENQTRYTFFTVPKDPSQKFFAYFFEYATKRMLGEEEDVDNLVSTLTELSPIKDTSILPPSVQAVVGYMTNKDFYFREDIWKGPRVEPREEFIPGRTSPFFIDVGEVTGLSPEKIGYSLGRIFTSGNLYSHLVGWGYKELFDDLPESENEQHIAMMLSQLPVLKRFIKVTNPYNKYRELVDDVSKDVSTKRWINTRNVDRLTEGYLFHKNVKLDEVREFIRSVGKKDGKEEAERMFRRLNFQTKVKDLNNRVFWLKLQRLTPEARAKVFSDVWSKANPERKEEMRGEMRIIGKGVFTERFFKELG
ncbi:hypothetical protein LCGC14_1696710, partial [marine sediment metagenome]